MKIIKFIPILLFVLGGFKISAQHKADQIDYLMTQCHNNGIFNGSILIAQKGKIIYHKALGFANLESKIVLDRNIPFSIASITKQITAMGIMILYEQGKLSYEDKIGTYFPSLPHHMKSVTIRNLLNHTSGIKDHYRVLPRKNLTNQDVIRALSRSDSLMFEPGTHWRYSNSGYCMLGMIIEKISRQSYSTFLDEHIFLPLGMTNTFVKTINSSDSSNVAIGFDRFGRKSDNDKYTYGSGGIYSTVEDMFRWSQALNNDKIVSKEILSEAFKPAVSNSGNLISTSRNKNPAGYGFGWFIHKDSMSGFVSHSGSYNGFKNIILKNRIEDIDIIFLTNNGWACPIFELESALMNIMIEEPFEIPKIPISVVLSQRDKKDSSLDFVATYYKCKNNEPEKYKFSKSELVYLGYYFLKNNELDKAEIIFKLNIDEYPTEWNPYDCYAEVCFKKEKYNLALLNYEKSLKINPENSNAKKMIIIVKEKLAEKKSHQ